MVEKTAQKWFKIWFKMGLYKVNLWFINPKSAVSDAEDRGGEGDLAESLARFILDADPAIAGVGAAERPSPALSSLSGLQGLDRHRVLPQPSSIPNQLPPHPQMSPGPSTSGEPSGPKEDDYLLYSVSLTVMYVLFRSAPRSFIDAKLSTAATLASQRSVCDGTGKLHTVVYFSVCIYTMLLWREQE